jgi:hypothetical protein
MNNLENQLFELLDGLNKYQKELTLIISNKSNDEDLIEMADKKLEAVAQFNSSIIKFKRVYYSTQTKKNKY